MDELATTKKNRQINIDSLKIYYKMSDLKQDEEGLTLLLEENVNEFNEWRLKNLTLKLDFTETDFSNKDISKAYLNGITFTDCNFTNSIVMGTNFVQSNLTRTNFESSDMSEALIMYATVRDSNISKSQLSNTNFMWSDLQNSDFRQSNMYKTIFVEADLRNANTEGLDKNNAYLKYAKLKGTSWE